jgi:hypothetical protein
MENRETWRSQRKKGGDVMIYYRGYDTDAYLSFLTSPHLPTPFPSPSSGPLLPIIRYSYSALKAVL